MKRVQRQISFGVAIIIAFFASGGAPIRATGAAVSQQRAAQHRLARLDSALRATVDDGTLGPQRVIVRVRPDAARRGAQQR